jgi:hypothetical protein
MVVSRPELRGREQAIGVRIVHQAAGNDSFKELATAFKEGDRAIGLGCRVVVFARFGQRDNGGVAPRVD